ncbi:MAG: DUF2191 domain-containing protein [Pseudomonadota bacterium]|nr:DUF2191 domain-containing protein [Pseudomonadota bacterium]
MRTTFDINDALLAKAKAAAAQEQTSLTRLIEEGLVLRLRPQTGRSHSGRPQLPIHAGSAGLTAAVSDPLTNRALLDADDGQDAE